MSALLDTVTTDIDAENELILYDRIEMIKTTLKEYGGQRNFYLSFSGGKDSMVLSKLLDLALPGNFIPRIYSDTGIEWNLMRDFVRNLSKTDHRVFIIPAEVHIKKKCSIRMVIHSAIKTIHICLRLIRSLGLILNV